MSNALATLTSRLASKFEMGANADELIGTLKQTAFKGQVSDAQMVALLIVANQYALNPWTKEIYAFPDRNNGIVPVVGVDGWSRIINSNDQFDGMDFEQDEESCTCRIYRKDRKHPIAITEYMAECKRDGVGPWNTHPKRMLRHKAMIQCARQAIG
jgi:phage recombination protein Bet